MGGSNLCTGSVVVSNPLLFTGQYRDDETRLYYLRARYYEPGTAQFVNVDPKVAETMAPYGYAAGDPIDRSDPTGLWTMPWNWFGRYEWSWLGQHWWHAPTALAETAFVVGFTTWFQGRMSPGVWNAFRHFYWTTYLCYYEGEDFAWGLVARHEWDFPGWPIDTAADWHNDKVGMAVGRALRSQDFLWLKKNYWELAWGLKGFFDRNTYSGIFDLTGGRNF